MLALVTRRRGLGDILNPTAGSQLDCGLFALGVFKPACWAITLGPNIVGKANYEAAVALANPDVVYPPLPAPVPPGAVTDYGMPATGAPPVETAQAAIDAAIADAKAKTDAQNLNYFSSVSANLDQLASAAGGSSLTPWLLAGGAALLVVLVARR